MQQADTAGAFTAVPTSGTPANIVVPSSLMPGGLTATQLAAKTYLDVSAYPDRLALWRAIHYLQEGIFKMTGKTLPVVSSTDLSSGIVLTTMAAASSDITGLVGSSLALNGTENDPALEAYFIGTYTNRALVVANSYDGLVHGAVELLAGDKAASGYQIGYEVLGMGPDWTNVPDYHSTALGFSESYAGQPGFLLRSLFVTSGQERGVGTIYTSTPLAAQTDDHPPDEPVQDSYNRWLVGTNMSGGSTPPFPGHAMQAYHKPVIVQLVANYTGNGAAQAASGFLAPTLVGPHTAQPTATSSNLGTVWIETNNPTAPNVYINQNSVWVAQSLSEIGTQLDVSAPLARNVVMNGVSVPGYTFNGMLTNVKGFFGAAPDAYYVLPTDMEDGALSDDQFAAACANKNWWADYRTANGLALGAYSLAGTQYAPVPAQTTETWWFTTGDVPNVQTDSIFAFNAWILHEYDKYVDGLAANPSCGPNGRDVVVNGVVQTECPLTSSGASKKNHMRTSFQSYAAHDVPPNFNPDPRTRVDEAAYPKHRGSGKWINVKNGMDVAKALAIMLPSQPPALYTILNSPFAGMNPATIGASHVAAYDQGTVKAYYDAGIRALTAEMNFDFGKSGLDYYMLAKMLWAPTQTAADLDAVRTRWLQRTFGPGATAMKQYYDFLAPENFPYNGPSFWATAMSYLDQAEAAINGGTNPPCANPTSPYQQRLDDVKQYWYFYYLMDVTPAPASASSAFKEFVWKGQMSYQTDMYMLTYYIWGNASAETDATPTYAGDSNGSPYLRAHYTHCETEAWWALVKAHWPVTHPHLFKDLKLANNQYGSSVDLNDLTPIVQFQPQASAQAGFLPTSPLPPIHSVETVARHAGDIIGYQMYWDVSAYAKTTTHYGLSWYDTVNKAWVSITDFPSGSWDTSDDWRKTNSQQPIEIARVQIAAPYAGTYRFDIQPAGWAPFVVSLDYDPHQGGTAQVYKPGGAQTFTYASPLDTYYTGGKIFYIPKGQQYLDFEIPAYAATLNYVFIFNTGLPASGNGVTRTVTVTPGTGNWKIGYNSIPVNYNEQGSLGVVYCTGGPSQYQKTPYLYSVPMLYSFNARELALPRALAAADNLAPLMDQNLFSNLVIDNAGTLGAAVDMNDVDGVTQFAGTGSSNYYTLNAMPPMVTIDTVAKSANDTIGFQMFWSDPSATPTTANYAISRWDAANVTWQSVLPFPTVSQPSVGAQERRGPGVMRTDSLVTVTYNAPSAGVYRFDIQPAGWAPSITSLDFLLALSGTQQQYASFNHTFSKNAPMDIWYGGPRYFYIPKKAQVLDFEIPNYSTNLTYTFSFFTGLPSTGLTFTRSVTVTPGSNGWQFGHNSIALSTANPNETGTIAAVSCGGGPSAYQKMPYLESVPMRYSYNFEELALPRRLITADGLTAQ